VGLLVSLMIEGDLTKQERRVKILFVWEFCGC